MAFAYTIYGPKGYYMGRRLPIHASPPPPPLKGTMEDWHKYRVWIEALSEPMWTGSPSSDHIEHILVWRKITDARKAMQEVEPYGDWDIYEIHAFDFSGDKPDDRMCKEELLEMTPSGRWSVKGPAWGKAARTRDSRKRPRNKKAAQGRR